MSRAVAFVVSAAVLLAAVACGHTIKHVVVLMEENRSFDHLLGWRKGINGLTGKEFNYVDPQNKSKGRINVTKDAWNTALCDPNHSVHPTTWKIFGPKAYKDNNLTNPDMSGFVNYEGAHHNELTDFCGVMDMFSVEHLPVMNGMADEFALFDRLFASVPGPTWSNRLFQLAGTAGGLTSGGMAWFMGETGRLFPQRTIFDQVKDAGKSWKNYVNDTPWELFLETVSHNPENIETMEDFYRDAREGTLPDFAYINPRCGANLTLLQGANDMHPDHDVTLGEIFYKDVYEALRASPSWNDTLLIVTYDEHGGFYDHVPTPLNVPPPGDGIPGYPNSFGFDRLGLRVPTLLLGPWVPKGMVISEPPAHAKPTKTSEFDLTSIMSSVRKILNITEGPLTDRDAWSAHFEYVLDILKEPRTDCPMHLPNPMPILNPFEAIAKESKRPLNSLQEQISDVHAHLAGEPRPAHVKTQGQVSDWLKGAFQTHKTKTLAWKQSKVAAVSGNHTVVVRCEPDELTGAAVKKGKWLTANWHLTGDSSPFITINAETGKKAYCLDAGNMTEGTVVTVSHCYPSVFPGDNRDRSQHWIRDDIRLKPYHRQDLCLTHACLKTSETVLKTKLTLQKCADTMMQRYVFAGLFTTEIAVGYPMYDIVLDMDTK
jgi:phospholipase C